MITIENESLRITISALGGTLHSILGKKTDTEYLWQGDEAIWNEQAPNLFPVIGRLKDKQYTLHGKTYAMGIHGFAAGKQMDLEERTADSCVFLLRDDDETRAVYPFRFAYRAGYALCGNVLRVCYRVTNHSDETMYFAVGGHPGFNVPLEKGLRFDDYALRFSEPCAPMAVRFSENVLVTGERVPYSLREGTVLPLKHALFDDDAIVLADAAKGVTLSSPKGERGLHVTYPDMRYVGFWHMPHMDAPYLCIEPWSALPGREGILEELSAMPDLTALAPGGVYENRWQIELW